MMAFSVTSIVNNLVKSPMLPLTKQLLVSKLFELPTDAYYIKIEPAILNAPVL
jgi:hypothetical protein